VILVVVVCSVQSGYLSNDRPLASIMSVSLRHHHVRKRREMDIDGHCTKKVVDGDCVVAKIDVSLRHQHWSQASPPSLDTQKSEVWMYWTITNSSAIISMPSQSQVRDIFSVLPCFTSVCPGARRTHSPSSTFTSGQQGLTLRIVRSFVICVHLHV